ncbi:MAG: hypothetical protein A2X42_05625 [Candidatus Margulisbacteria bacterium GWF2_38_17]|nr:MAG: hypothetical protein A2X42_05625 [Candidatus Margulisbacteria bacterium GWF2_38_17]
MRVIISTVGTSLLSNLKDCDRKLLAKTANHREGEYAPEEKRIVNNYIDEARCSLLGYSLENAKKLSAELNGLSRVGLAHQDIYYFIVTDTYQCRQTAGLIKEYLTGINIHNAEIVEIRYLTSSNSKVFFKGISELVRWFYSDDMRYINDPGIDLIFNSSGGFKIVQGFVTAIAMLSNAQISYIFEGEDSDLVSIPKLPIKLETSAMKKYPNQFMIMADAEIIADLPAGIDDIFLDTEKEGSILSPWGLIMWEKNKSDVFFDRLLEWPGLVYENNFKNDFKSIVSADEKVKLQEVLYKVQKLMKKGDTSQLKKDGGLQYENFENKKYNGLPIGHFRVTQERRVSCVASTGKLYLRKYGAHDYVNDNP